jgi:phage terminase large subunit GpA-like protein
MAESAKVFGGAFRDGLRPQRQLTVSEWADRYRRLSGKASDEQGPYRTSRTPYLREVMDSLSSSSPVERVVFMKGSQLGGSEAGYNWLGYIMDHAPGPTMMVQPREVDAKRHSRQRLDPMVEECATLRAKVADRRSRDSANTVLLKEFPGGVLILTGANSASGLKSMPVRNLMLDEVDLFPPDVEGEGDPVELAWARTRNFSGRKLLEISSPTIEGRSRIAADYDATDRRVFVVPCPFCQHHQTIDWARIKWDKAPAVGDGPEIDLPETVHLVCESCGARIPEHHKTRMMAGGFWLVRNHDADPKARGYWLSALYSPLGWLSWADIVTQWLKAKGRRDKLKVFINTVLAETWKEKGEAPEWDRLHDRREHYAFGSVPKGGLFLTAGCDVQQDRIELEVVAWGRGLESWSVQYLVLPGKPEEAQVWLDLARELSMTFPHENGVAMPLRAVAIDSSYATQHVYRWVRSQQVGRVFAIKGTDDQGAMVMQPKAVEVQAQGKRLQRGLKLWQIGGPVVKHELYAFLRLPRPTMEGQPYPAGYCHFPEYGPEYFKQLTAEQVVVALSKKGYRTYSWEKTRERNEALDCRVYARAAAAILGVDRFTDVAWDALDATLGTPAPVRPAPPNQPKKPPRQQGGGGYLQRWQ